MTDLGIVAIVALLVLAFLGRESKTAAKEAIIAIKETARRYKR